MVDKKVDEGEVDVVQQILDKIPQRALHQVLDPILNKKQIIIINVKTFFIHFTHPEERVNKVHQELQDPVQRPETADVDVNAAKMIDLPQKLG